MEDKLLQLFRVANELNKKQDNIYAQIRYLANDVGKLEISIISKKEHTFLENIELQLNNNSILSIDSIIDLFESYVKGYKNDR